ncbi:MAG: recombinase family protein [Protaetiibacter sp.]
MKVRAAIYVRVSTADQIDNTSLDDQRRLCRAAIDLKDGWEFAEEYADEGRSGTDSDRPEWKRMLADVQAGRVQAVVVAKLDRFARKAADAIRETDRLSELGAMLVVVKEQIDLSTPAGKAMRTMLAGFAEFERDTIVQRTSHGQRAAASMGRWPGGKPSYGWRLEGKAKSPIPPHPVPDEREREIIETVWHCLVKRRMSTGEVAAFLNDTGRRPRKGERWERTTVRNMAMNPTLHDGLYHWGKGSGRPNAPKSHHTRMSPDGMPKYGPTASLDMGNPPLTKQQWDAMQRALTRRTPATAPSAPVTQLLTLRIVGDCGQHYNGVTLSAAGRVVYRCAGRRHKVTGGSRCDCPSFDARWIEAVVWGEVVGLLSTPERLQAAAREWLGLDREPDNMDADSARIVGLDQQIAKTERATERARKLALFEDDPTAQLALLNELQQELSDLRDRRGAMAALAADRGARARALTDLAEIAERMQGRLGSMPLAAKRRVVELLDIQVQVTEWGQKGKIRYPVALSITGRLDPRLLAGGEGLAITRTVPDGGPESPASENTEPGGRSFRSSS